VGRAAVEAASRLAGCNQGLADKAQGLCYFGKEAETARESADGGGLLKVCADPGCVCIGANGELAAFPALGEKASTSANETSEGAELVVAVELADGDGAGGEAAERPEGDAVRGLDVQVGMSGVEGSLGFAVEGCSIGVIDQ